MLFSLIFIECGCAFLQNERDSQENTAMEYIWFLSVSEINIENNLEGIAPGITSLHRPVWKESFIKSLVKDENREEEKSDWLGWSKRISS